MEDHKENSIIDNVKKYVQTRVELATLTAVDKFSHLFAGIVTNVILAVFALLTFLFLSVGLALYISALMDNTYSGFFIMGGFYLLLAVIVYASKDKLDKSMSTAVIKKLFKERNEDKYEKED